MPDLHAQTDKPIFISYSRANRAFALDLRQKLTDLGFKLWRDIEDMPIGEKWWQAIREAIQACETLVLCMSPESLASPNVADEWHYAREHGKRVMSIVVEAVDFSTVPRWMGRFDWADFRPGAKDADLVWARFINQLNTPYVPRKVPFMVEALPSDFVPRPTEFELLVQALVNDTHGAVAISAALKGAGGFGKTTLARAICHDNRVRAAFDDGVLWVTLGEKISEQVLIGKLLDLIVVLTGQRLSMSSVDAAQNELRKAIGSSYLLLIIDDVWQSAHLQPFLSLGKNAATLITTRNSGVLPPDTIKQSVDAMKANEALALLRYKLPIGEDAAMPTLAKRLGEWPLLLKLANGALRKRIERGESLKAGLEWVEKGLTRKSFDALADPDNKDQRHRAASAALGVSLELLDGDQRACYERLAVFPEDADIPLVTLEKLWGCDDFDVEERCQRYADLSLLLVYDLAKRTIRLHDVVRTYLRDTHKGDLMKWNADFLDAYNVSDWSALPAGESYLWRGLAYHLTEAGRRNMLRELLLDYRFLHAKLCATDTDALVIDCNALLEQGRDEMIRLLRLIFFLSDKALAADPNALGHQLVGRLMAYRQQSTEIHALTDRIPTLQAGLYPVDFESQYVTHTQAGGALMRTLSGHTNTVNGAVALADGRLLSWSDDKMLRLWGADGQPLSTLIGHTRAVNGVLTLADGRLLSWSRDATLRLWETDGQPMSALEGHNGVVRGTRELADGRLLSWSEDGTLRLWKIDGQPLSVLEGHTAVVRGTREFADGRLLSWSSDGTLRLWGADGSSLFTLIGHTGGVRGTLALADGRLLSWSQDATLRLWGTDGRALFTLTGHRSEVSGALALADGRLLSWSTDNTLRLWEADGQALSTLVGHIGGVRGALALADGRLLSWSDDKTLRLWTSDGQPIAPLSGHTRAVRGVLVLADGRLLSWSDDKTLRLWTSDGQPIAPLSGHTEAVGGVLALSEGTLLSWSADQTLRLWEIDGQPPSTLTGHMERVLGTLALTDGRLLSWSEDKTLRLWTSDGQSLSTLAGHTSGVRGALALIDGRLLSWSRDKTLRLWTSDGQPLSTLTGHSEAVSGALVLADGRLLSWSADQTLRLWGIDGQLLFTLMGHTGAVSGALALADGRLLSWSADRTLRLWGIDGQLLFTLTGHRSEVRGVLALADGRLLSWSADRTLRLWEADGQPLFTLTGHRSEVRGVLALADGRFLSWSAGRTLLLWSIDGQPLFTLIGHTSVVRGALALADGRFLSWSADRTLRLWAGNGTPLDELNEDYYSGNREPMFSWARQYSIDPDVLFAGDVRAAGGRVQQVDNVLTLYNSHDGKTIARFFGDADFNCATILSDGTTNVAGDDVGRVLFLRYRD